MKRFVKKAAAAAMALALAVGMMTGCSTSKDLKTQNAKKVLFTYDNTEVTLQEAWIYAKMTGSQYDAYYGQYYGADFWLTPMGTDDDGNSVTMEDYIKQQVISQIKLVVVLNNKAEEYKVSLTDEEKEECAKFAKEFAETEEGAKILKECGASEEDMAAIYEKNKIANKVQEASIADQKFEVSDDEARETTISRIVYAKTKTDDQGQTVDMTDAEKAEAKKKAEDALTKIKAGTDLATVAEEAEYSNTSETFATGESEEGAAFEEKLASMKDGDLMDGVMECDNGYVVAQLVAYTDKEATASNKDSMIEEKQYTAFQEIYQGWIKDLEEKWDYKKDVDQTLWAEVVLHSEESTATEAAAETDTAVDEASTEAATEAPAEATTQAK